uniref:Uncharacterized protein n=1 Tax=Meloidogyne incognita TaxID=6306 RepID=A0A914M1X1_MELIC
MLEAFIDKAWSCFFEKENVVVGNNKEFIESSNKSNNNNKNNKTINSSLNSSIYQQQNNIESIEQTFLKILSDLDLNEECQAELISQPLEWKWKVIISGNERQKQKENIKEGGGDYYAKYLEKLLLNIEEEEKDFVIENNLVIKKLEGLAATLRTESFSWLEQFLGAGGLEMLQRLLNKCNSRGSSAELIALPLLCSIRALLNSTIGRHWVQESAEALKSVAWALDLQSVRCKVISLEILSGLCFCAEFGHRAVLKALTQVKLLRGERTRFQRLIDDLFKEHGNTPRDTARVRLALISLINALLKGGAAEHSLEYRIHLRHEFLMLGIVQVLEQIRSAAPEGSGSALDDHIDLFEMMRQEDEQEMQSTTTFDSGSASPIDFENPSVMAEVLTQRLDHTLALPHFISLLQHLLMVPTDERHLPLWRCFDLLLQQLTLKSAMNGLDPLRVDPQLSEHQQFSKKLDWDELLGRLRTEAECEKLERKLQETEEELVKERKRILELENCLSDLQDSASLVSFSRVSEHSSASISSSYSSSPSDPFHSSNNNISNIFGNNSNQQLPPIRPPIGQAPPPPPPSARQLRSGNETLIISSNKSIPKKKVPIPLCPVKTLNWTPIPKDKLKGTIWENLDEKNIYNQIDIEALSEQFAAGKSGTDEQQHSIEGNSFTLHRSLALRQANQITVIDSRRAQNCTIMLARLKMSHRDIRHTLLGMDERCKLSRDILEQMLKFVPLKEELNKMKETLTKKRKQHQSLALADRFLWEMGQVPRYEQRLKCLCTIRSFQDRCSEIRPGILAISRASHTLCNSKRLIQFLALILAVGNILNEGKRLGNCYGFTISSIDQIPSVRSTIRPDRNLLHFLVETIEHNWPDLFNLKREMNSVLEASKVDRQQIEKELFQLEKAIFELNEELNYYQKKFEESNNLEEGKEEEKEKIVLEIPEEPFPQQKGGEGGEGGKIIQRSKQPDRFVVVVKTFLEEAKKQMTQLREELTEMRQKLSDCVHLFGVSIESKRPNSEIILPHSDQFFGPFARCFSGLADCHRTVRTEREEIEAKKRQFQLKTLFNQRRKESGRASRDSSHLSVARVYKNGGKVGKADRDFEAIVNMLQTGELFSEELSRLRTSVRIKGPKTTTTIVTISK